MTSRSFVLLVSCAALAGCAGGSTIRAVDGEDTAGEPVALAPVPDTAPERDPRPRAAAAPAPAPDVSPVERGYAPYGNTGTLEVRRIGQWTHTRIGEARRTVIRDANAWAEFWSELGTGDRPDVDFTRNVVVAVAAGQRPSGGHEIAVDRVTESDGQLTIEVLETTPGPNCITAGSVTQPVDVVVVPATEPRGWSFLERKEIRGCR
jgi:hypothetical protein